MSSGVVGGPDARSDRWDALSRQMPLGEAQGREGGRRTTGEVKARAELERKFAWALGSTFLEEYRRAGGLSRVARRLALYVIDAIGAP